MSPEVAETRALLDQAVASDLPELEAAILTGDYDLAFAQAAIVRDIRARVRGLLGGADGAGELRAEWAKAEPRIDAALIAAPRPNADPATGRQNWQTQRTARGTDAHTRRPRLTSATGMPSRAKSSGGVAAGSTPPPAGRQPGPTASMKAVGAALDAEIYFAPNANRPGVVEGRDGDMEVEPRTVKRKTPLPRPRDR